MFHKKLNWNALLKHPIITKHLIKQKPRSGSKTGAL